MKVIHPGTLFYSSQCLHGEGWIYASDGEPATQRELLKAILLHIAARHGVQLVAEAPAEPVPTADVERLTLDVIAQARWEAR